MTNPSLTADLSPLGGPPADEFFDGDLEIDKRLESVVVHGPVEDG